VDVVARVAMVPVDEVQVVVVGDGGRRSVPARRPTSRHAPVRRPAPLCCGSGPG